MGRYRTILRQWSLVESEMAKAYDLTLADLFHMSWRRFSVLFDAVLNWGEGEDLPTGKGSGALARTVDWGAAGEQPPENIVNLFKGQTIPISKSGAGE